MLTKLLSVKVLPWLLVGTALVSGTLGWRVNGWRLHAAQQRAADKAEQAYRERLADDLEHWKLQVEVLQTEAQTLRTDLTSLRKHNAALVEDINDANLLVQRGPGCTGNPFSDDFVRLWNGASAPRAPAGPAP